MANNPFFFCSTLCNSIFISLLTKFTFIDLQHIPRLLKELLTIYGNLRVFLNANEGGRVQAHQLNMCRIYQMAIAYRCTHQFDCTYEVALVHKFSTCFTHAQINETPGYV